MDSLNFLYTPLTLYVISMLCLGFEKQYRMDRCMEKCANCGNCEDGSVRMIRLS